MLQPLARIVPLGLLLLLVTHESRIVPNVYRGNMLAEPRARALIVRRATSVALELKSARNASVSRISKRQN
jgi:hypothetical protein